MTRLCVAIFVNDPAQSRRDMALACEHGADLVELRLDDFDADASAVVRQAPVPVIVTVRPTWEGGRSAGSDSSRLDQLGELAPLAYAADVELETCRRLRFDRSRFARLILSSHDFTGRPPRLTNLVHELNESPADIAKIVWTARSIRDNIEAFEILLQRQKPTIALCMGEAGLISRVLAKKFGAFLSFASLDSTGGTADGQIPVAEMKRLYRWDAIDSDTRVFGVVGSPVGHSMSPAIHNAAFEHVGFNGVYLPLLVEKSYESFKAFMESFLAFEPLDLGGLSITIPHKENALRYLKQRGAEIDPLAENIGVLNTISIRREGGTLALFGTSTDYAAILDSITAKLNITRADLADFRVAVIGAGGTGRTAVAALAACGATVVVYNRTRDRAEALAAEFNGRCGKVVTAPLEKLGGSCCQIYLNTTSIGMTPHWQQSAWGERLPKLSADSLAFDAVYNPIRTTFLEQARAAGAKTIDGVEMFVRQAQGQFEAWTGKPAPLDLMRQIVQQRLTPQIAAR